MAPLVDLVLSCVLLFSYAYSRKMYQCSTFENSHLLEYVFEVYWDYFGINTLINKAFKWAQFLSCVIAGGTPCLFL